MFKNAKGCFGLIVVLLCLGFAVRQFFAHLHSKALDEARSAQTSATYNSKQLIEESEALDGLAQFTSQYVEIEAYVCDYFESSDGQFFMDLTAAYQGDTSVVIAQHLDALHFTAMDDLEACDSSIIRTATLYNFQEASKKIFINAEIIDQEHADLANQLIYNKPCKFYKSKQKRHYHRLENFCYNYIKVKGRLNHVKSVGDSVYISMDRAIARGLGESKWRIQ
jgi:hypothetical protein